MPRFPGLHLPPARALSAALGCALILTISGCGSSNEKFTSGEANRAIAALEAVQQNVDDGRCAAAQKRVNVLAIQSTHINRDRPELGDAYASSVARLQTLVARECVEIKPASPTPEVTKPTGSTGDNGGTTPVQPTDGGNTPPDNGGGQDNGGGGQDNGGGNNGGGNNGGSPPDNSGGAAPGV